MLKTHLSNIGLKDFDDREKLFEWGYSLLKNYKIPSNVIVTFFKYLKKVENNNSYFYKKKLYKIAACNKVLLNFFHSIEFSRIYKSGSHIAKNIKNNKQILDLGCNSGYLTSYYAKKFSLSNFTGIDNCSTAIATARNDYKKNKNLIFSSDIKYIKNFKFDYIIDTQCLSDISDKSVVNYLIKLLSKSLNFNGNLISISTLTNENEAKSFISKIESCGLNLQKIKAIFFSSYDKQQALSKLIFSKKSTKLDFNINKYFNDIRNVIF